MNRDAIIRMLGSDWTDCERFVREALRSDIALLNRLNDGLLENGGKQLRPMLSLLVARACGACNDDSRRYAAAAELLHNATLLHDDVADESATRRNRPTLSALMGPTTAVLVGDFWLAKVVGLVVSSQHHESVIPLYAKTLSDLAEGEMFQLEKAEKADTAEADYLHIVYGKTASLFETACRAAALSADAPHHLVEAAGRYGAATGIGFQIRDDMLDYGTDGQTGKPVGSDLKEGKMTLPLIGALAGYPEEAALRGRIRQVAAHPDYCEEIRRFVLERGGLAYAAKRLDDYVQEALTALEVFPPSPERDALEQLTRYNADRTR
ncbi:MAG: polyprenyl synthetase family protein [Bacteroidales bacterium]|nr:polyprenyl synthetase family protein [Bacteroidales bacterium]